MYGPLIKARDAAIAEAEETCAKEARARARSERHAASMEDSLNKAAADMARPGASSTTLSFGHFYRIHVPFMII
jgi:hypothetical protein